MLIFDVAITIKLERARPEDADTLTSIAVAAKRHWGYPESWIRSWQKVLTVTPEYVESHPTYIARVDAEIVGFCALQIEGGRASLDHFWVAPPSMRQGVGRALFARAEEVAKQGGAVSLQIESDPHAEGFYRRMGAKVCGRQPATMDGQERYRPLLVKTL